MTLYTKTTSSAAMLALADFMREIIQIITDLPDGIPSGHLYAMLMGKLSLPEYERFECLMLASGKIVKQGEILKGAGK